MSDETSVADPPATTDHDEFGPYPHADGRQAASAHGEDIIDPEPEPDAPPNAVERQLKLFEGHKPKRFLLRLAGSIELALADEKQADLAESLKFRKTMEVHLIDPADRATKLVFHAKVTDRGFNDVRHAEHGDTMRSTALLRVTGAASDGEED